MCPCPAGRSMCGALRAHIFIHTQGGVMDACWENLPSSPGFQASPYLPGYTGTAASAHSPAASVQRSPFRLSDRFIPSRSAVARLDYSILDRELVTAEVSRNASEREVRVLISLQHRTHDVLNKLGEVAVTAVKP